MGSPQAQELPSPRSQQQFNAEELKDKLGSQYWRLNNLYAIVDATGRAVPFRMNWVQKQFYKNLHYFNVVLKSRQLGFSTFILLYFLDGCLFNENMAAGVVADTRESAEDLFKNKVRAVYDNLPEWLRLSITATSESARKIEFSNGSSITVGTSLRGGTYQRLHISEYGKIAARYPEKALEIKTGALNTVHAGQQIFVESTAEGRQGEYWELCELARKLKDSNAYLTSLDPRFHFYGWQNNPEYSLRAEVSIDLKMQEYFAKLKSAGINLTPEQKVWYVKKYELLGELIKREFPSLPEEAFEQAMEGAYYTKQMETVRRLGHIRYIPYEATHPVHTFWDLGKGAKDAMAIWFFQHIQNEYRFIRYHESFQEGWEYYTNLLKSFNYNYGIHHWPHDGGGTIQGMTLVTKKDLAQGLGINPIKIIPVTSSVQGDIMDRCRPVLPRCFFDETLCKEGIAYLDAYRKEWDTHNGVWKDKPRHDQASHCADAFRTFAVGYSERSMEINWSPGWEGVTFAEMDYQML